MKSQHLFTVFASVSALALAPGSSALAQRPQPTPEQRIDRLEREMNQVQRQVFPKGQPAATAGFSDEPAATQSSVISLDQRLDSLERQMTDLLRQSEENNHQLQQMQSDIGRARADQEQRLSTLEQRMNEAAAAAPAAQVTSDTAAPPAARPGKPTPGKGEPKAGSAKPTPTTSTSAGDSGSDAAAPTDPGEDAYTQGFRQWEAGQYDDAITNLKAFTAAYPKHRRVSYANNLIGRALLDKGQPRAAAEALLANYRNNPKGERAPDSLYYLGQALTQLGQVTQACKAYQELDAVYGAKVRADLRKQVDDAKAKAQCG